MQLNAYLLFNGQCQEAFRFYEGALGAKIETLLLHEGTPAEVHVPAEWRNKVMHGRITVNGQTVLASDCPPDRYTAPQGFSINLGYEEPSAADRVFQALSDGGTVQMPIQETFWAKRWGMVVDRFGIPWMINCEKARIEFENMETCGAAAR
jgi:PhnB protein